MIKLSTLKEMINYYIEHKSIVDGELNKFGKERFSSEVLDEWKRNLDKIEEIFKAEKIKTPLETYTWKVFSTLNSSGRHIIVENNVKENGKEMLRFIINGADFTVYEKPVGTDGLTIFDCLQGSWKNTEYKQEVLNAIVDTVFLKNANIKKLFKNEKKSLIKTMINWEKELNDAKSELLSIEKRVEQIKRILPDAETLGNECALKELLSALIKQKNSLTLYIDAIEQSVRILPSVKNTVIYQTSKLDAKVGKLKKIDSEFKI